MTGQDHAEELPRRELSAEARADLMTLATNLGIADARRDHALDMAARADAARRSGENPVLGRGLGGNDAPD